jgi:hypothetical protein
MGRLHLLQGMSGIGKTTLPKAFATAIGADYAVIEVQAGWRDRQDLLGHLNAFERRYYETAFTKAVYRAGCPRHRDRPFFIILDEMNLAHPEQYFADVLSGLENDAANLRLQLVPHAVEPAAALLETDKGTYLPVPGNVWFFGTSNHDETTVQFADKTYDRANVIELPSLPPTLTAGEPSTLGALSVRNLQRDFAWAADRHRAAGDDVIGFLRGRLGEHLRDTFGIGWGPRLDRQIRAYAPVVVAAGGSCGEVADHVLATRILRRLKGRFDLRGDQVLELRDLVSTEWSTISPAGAADEAPMATHALLDQLVGTMG